MLKLINKTRKFLVLGFIFTVFVLLGIFIYNSFSIDIFDKQDIIKSQNNSFISIVPLEKIVNGCSPPDGIPSIDKPYL